MISTYMRRSFYVPAIVALALFIGFMGPVLVPSSAVAQTESAAISGRVTDQSGAVVPGAEIELRNVDTNVTQLTKSNSDGFYSLPSLRPGNYVMSVRKQSFRTVSVTGITLSVQDNLSRNFTLQIGSSSESVTIVASAATVETEDGTVRTTVDPEFVDRLPLNGRSFLALLSLVPGYVPDQDPHLANINGQRGVSNSTNIDGVSANISGGSSSKDTFGQNVNGSTAALTPTGSTQSIAIMDELQEFTVQTAGYGAQFGRQSGGQISFATKSGTNQFHGSASYYFRNEILDANDWFLNSVSPPVNRPELRQNDVSGTLGGPIVKDKTFFFVAFEYDPLVTPSVVDQPVPTLLYRQMSPWLAPLLNALPLPNGAVSTDGLTGQLTAAYRTDIRTNALSLKLDQQFGGNFKLFARYHRSPSSFSGQTLGESRRQYSHTQTGTAGNTWVLGPNLVSETRFNYSRSSEGQVSDPYSTVGQPPPLSALLPAGYNLSNAVGNTDLGDVNFLAFSVGFLNGGIQHQFQLTENLSWARGNHRFDFGFDWRRLRPDFAVQPYLFVDDILSGPGNQALGFASSSPAAGFAISNLSLYAADSWKLNSRLTLNLGLRWEFEPPPSTVYGPKPLALENFDPANPANDTFAPAGSPLWKTRYGNCAPRVGLAYQIVNSPGRETVLRSAFGIYYDIGLGETLAYVLDLTNFNNGDLTTYPEILSDPLATTAPPVLTSNSTNKSVYTDPRLQMPYTAEWNVGVEQALGGAQTLSVNYIGSKGNRLLLSERVPAFLTQSALFQQVSNGATSNYNGLQLQLNRRVVHGLSALVNYTFSHSIDDSSAENLGPELHSFDSLASERASSDFDVRHIFTAAATYEVSPAFHHQMLNKILSGWSLSPLVRLYSPRPLAAGQSPVYQFYDSNTNVSYQLRPDLVPGQPVWISNLSVPGGKEININAFSIPTFTDDSQVRQGTLGRNAVRGFWRFQTDLSLAREFQLRERIGVRLAAEVFNIFNNPVFADPNAQLGTETIPGGYIPPSSATFGQSTSTLASAPNGPGASVLPIYAFGGHRDIQLALKITF